MSIAKLSITFLLAATTALSSSAQTPAGSAPAASVGGGPGFAKPTTQAQLQALLQAAMNGQSVMFDPNTSVTVSGTMTILVPDNPGIWLFHCHLNGHLQAGMEARFAVVP